MLPSFWYFEYSLISKQLWLYIERRMLHCAEPLEPPQRRSTEKRRPESRHDDDGEAKFW